MYKIKNTRLKLESRISHLHKIFYSAHLNNASSINRVKYIFRIYQIYNDFSSVPNTLLPV